MGGGGFHENHINEIGVITYIVFFAELIFSMCKVAFASNMAMFGLQKVLA
jgi:hypothetical protein